MNQANPTPFAVINGQLLPDGQAGFPAHHQSLVDSFGIYETVKVENGRFFHLAWHLRRLGQSAGIIGLDLPARDADVVGQAHAEDRVGQHRSPSHLGRVHCVI